MAKKPESENGSDQKTTKSIVPAKYSGKYRAGQRDELGQFIDDQCSGKEGFEYDTFFQLCRDNGVVEAQVAKFQGLVAAKVHGAQGRARMTLRNMLEPIARKEGGLKDLKGKHVDLNVPPRPATGAAKAAQETARAA